MARAGVSAARLADACGVSEAAVSKWAKEGQIARKQIPAICATLRCSADELLGIKSSVPSAGRALRSDALADAIEIVEKGLANSRVTLTPAKRAGLIIAIYELVEESGRPVESATILRLIRLAS